VDGSAAPLTLMVYGDFMVRIRNRLGFTLVELLVVIGIIAIIMSILLPSMRAARMQALEVVCTSNDHQWGVALQMYVDNNHGQLPQKGPDGSSSANAFGPLSNGNGVIGFDDPSLWFNALPIYMTGKTYYQMLLDKYHHVGGPPQVGDSSIWMCPLMSLPANRYNPSASPPGMNDLIDAANPSFYQLWGVDSTRTIKNGLSNVQQFDFNSSFVFNSKLLSTMSGESLQTIVMSRLRNGSQTVVMVERAANFAEYTDPVVQAWNAAHPSYNLQSAPPQMDAQGSFRNMSQPKCDWTRFSCRHNHGGNILFADGHVAWFAWSDVQPLGGPANDANQPSKVIWSVLGAVN
jgi:prepilin-type processing-associated H-X9-DG protein/prepilin-type N-terminal cleavage/methylation domain-containing protein